MVTRLVYVSKMGHPLADVELQIILGQAQIRNRRLDITGLLVVSGRYFCQTLEGRMSALEDVMQRVQRDPRHQDIRILTTDTTPRRRFPVWAMHLLLREDWSQRLTALHEQSSLPMQQDLSVLDLLMSERT